MDCLSDQMLSQFIACLVNNSLNTRKVAGSRRDGETVLRWGFDEGDILQTLLRSRTVQVTKNVSESVASRPVSRYLTKSPQKMRAKVPSSSSPVPGVQCFLSLSKRLDTGHSPAVSFVAQYELGGCMGQFQKT